VVVGDLRVQQIERKDGRRSWTIVWSEGTVHTEADRFLRLHDGSGTQRTYAYLLVDHLRWLERECLAFAVVQLRDLERYMGIVGAEVRMPLGEPWRVGKRPYGRSALSIAAACLKGFYLHQSSLGINGELGKKLDKSRDLALHLRVQLREPFLSFARLLGPAAYPVKHPVVLLYLVTSSYAFHDRAPRPRSFQFTKSTVPFDQASRGARPLVARMVSRPRCVSRYGTAAIR